MFGYAQLRNLRFIIDFMKLNHDLKFLAKQCHDENKQGVDKTVILSHSFPVAQESLV